MINDRFKRWLKAAVIRAVKTFAETMLAALGTTALHHAIDWRLILSTAALSALLALLSAIAGLPEVNDK